MEQDSSVLVITFHGHDIFSLVGITAYAVTVFLCCCRHSMKQFGIHT